MNDEQYPISDRLLTIFSPLTRELPLDPHQNYLFDLSYLTGLSVQGEQGCAFLQGQLSCDVREITPHHMRQAVLCNVKGRILALLDVIQWGATFHLILPHDLLPSTQITLAKTALLSKVTLQATTDYEILGLYRGNPNEAIPYTLPLPTSPREVVQDDLSCCYHLGGGRYLLLVKKEQATTLIHHAIEQNQWRGSLAWHALQLTHGTVEIYPSSRGLFLPHRLDLHQTGHLNFNKGCYKGQEIIARMHYRATQKHTLAFFTTDTQLTLQPGQTIFDPHESTPLGEVIDYGPIASNTWCIAASMLLNYPTTLRFDGLTEPVTVIPILPNPIP